MSLLGDRQHAHLGGHDDALVAGDEIARGAQPIAIEGGADLASVGEGDCRRAVPRLHQRGVILVEGAPLLVHERIARPGLRDHHHHRMRERIAALHQELERVVEAGGIGLALVGDRPQPVDVVAEQVRGHRGLPRRHPVVVAAQRVDLAVVGDHPVGMRQRPGREGVGGEALVHQRQRALEVRIVQVGIIGDELVGEEHALVDDGAAGDRDRVVAGEPALLARVDRVRDRLAQDVEPPLELGLGLDLLAAADEHLLVHGLGRLDRFAERRVVGRHVAPAQQRHALALDHLGIDVADHLPPIRIARHEQLADRVFARIGQREAEPVRLLGEELVRDLHQDAGAVAGARIGADRAAMLEIAQDGERVLDQLVGLAALDVGNEADAAGILVERRVVEPLRPSRSTQQAAGCARASCSLPPRRCPQRGARRRRAAPCLLALISSSPRPARAGICPPFGAAAARRGACATVASTALLVILRQPAAVARRGRVAARVGADRRCTVHTARRRSEHRPDGIGRIRLLGQQYCPTLPCQILAVNTRVRLSGKCSFLAIVSGSCPRRRAGIRHRNRRSPAAVPRVRWLRASPTSAAPRGFDDRDRGRHRPAFAHCARSPCSSCCAFIPYALVALGLRLGHGAGVFPFRPEQDRGPAHPARLDLPGMRRSLGRIAGADQALDVPAVRDRVCCSADAAGVRRLPVQPMPSLCCRSAWCSALPPASRRWACWP